MLKTLRHVADDLREVLAEFEPERLSGPDAARVLEAFADIEKLASGGKLLSARRVETSNVWRRTGHRSAAAHVAEATGVGIGPAIHALKAARQLGNLPTTEEALRNGQLSEVQVKEITDAAIHQPQAEQELVETAQKEPLNLLKLRCRRVKATGTDQNANYDAIHRSRYLRHWTDNDGAVRFDARLTPDAGARLVASIKAEADRLGVEARRAGLSEPHRALSADALVRLTSGSDCLDRPAGGSGAGNAPSGRTSTGRTARSGVRRSPGAGGGVRVNGSRTSGDASSRETGCPHTGPAAMVHVRVDHEALMRGSLRPGEICEIPGIGPIPVEVARRLAVDSILSVLVTDGVDVTAVAHAGRTIPASLRRALIERDPVCAVPGCETADGLEIDHVEPFAQGGETSLANLVRLCHWHHYLKTHQRHRLEWTEEGWRWEPPDRAPTLDLSG